MGDERFAADTSAPIEGPRLLGRAGAVMHVRQQVPLRPPPGPAHGGTGRLSCTRFASRGYSTTIEPRFRMVAGVVPTPGWTTQK